MGYIPSNIEGMIPDGGFESGNIGKWTSYRSDYAAMLEITEDSRSGKYALLMPEAEINYPLTLEPNTTYMLSYYMKSSEDRQRPSRRLDSKSADMTITKLLEDKIGQNDTWVLEKALFRTSDFIGTREATLVISSYNSNWTAQPQFIIDDLYFGKHIPYAEITGADEIIRPKNGASSRSESYSAKITNMAGDESFIVEGSENISWSLADEYNGITLDCSNITVTADADLGEIELICNVTADSVEISEGDGTTDISGCFVKKIKISPVAPKITDLVPQVRVSENKFIFDMSYAYFHEENTPEKDSVYSWQISDTYEGNYTEFSQDKKSELATDFNGFIRLAVTLKCENSDEIGETIYSTPINAAYVLNNIPIMDKSLIKTDNDVKMSVGVKLMAVIPDGLNADAKWYRKDNETVTEIETERTEYTVCAADAYCDIYARVYPYVMSDGWKIYGAAVKSNELAGPVRPMASTVSARVHLFINGRRTA